MSYVVLGVSYRDCQYKGPQDLMKIALIDQISSDILTILNDFSIHIHSNSQKLFFNGIGALSGEERHASREKGAAKVQGS